MQKLMFDLNDNVKVIYDKFDSEESWFIGMEGVIEDVTVNEYNETVYGLKTENNEDLLYFLAIELELI
jgi:hypothetical protein